MSNTNNGNNIDLAAASGAALKVRRGKEEFVLLLAPAANHPPSALYELIEKAVEKAPTVIQVIGAEILTNCVAIEFDNDNSRKDLLDLLVSKRIIKTDQILGSRQDQAGMRFLITNLDPTKYKAKRHCETLVTAMLKYLSKNTAGADFEDGRFRVVDVDDGQAIAIVRDKEAADYLVAHPNIFIGLKRAVAVHYPPADFCTTCCSLDHNESMCMAEAQTCYVCGGDHLGKTCKASILNCPNCSKHPTYKRRTRHSANSTLCKSRVEKVLQLYGFHE